MASFKKALKATAACFGIAVLCIVELYNLMGFADYFWRGLLP